MATFEDLRLVEQSHQNFENLRRDMRANAQAYLAAVTAGTPVVTIGALIRANTVQYLRRLDWARDRWADLTIRAKIQSGLAAWSLQQTELLAIYDELRAAADAENTKPVTTAAEIQTLANATLAAIPPHNSIWPE